MKGLSPDQVISASVGKRRSEWPTTLETLAYWIADDVADALWGPSVGDVDLNSQLTTNRIALPPGVKVGERLVVTFDPGSRLDAVVSLHADGTLGSELDLKSIRHSPPAEVEWGWGVGSGIGPHYLPGDEPGGATDSYAVVIDETYALKLTNWALAQGESPDVIGHPWKTSGDAIRAMEALHLMYRDARWFYWGRATEALLDGDEKLLNEAIVHLG